MAPFLNSGRQKQRFLQYAHGPIAQRRDYARESGRGRRNSSQDARSYRDDEHSQGKKAASVASHFKNRHYSGHKNESFETILLGHDICARQLSLSSRQMPMCFPNAHEAVALNILHTRLSMDTPFSKIVQSMSR